MAMTTADGHLRAVVPAVLPLELCRELWFQHLACAVPGYRPGCTASCLASAPSWAWPALLRARQLLRDAAEEIFDDFGGLFPETTVTVGWFPGAGLPVHTDNCQDYLRQRHVTVVVWLNEGERDFQGGEFFFDHEENAMRPQAGHAAIFGADVPHGLTAVTGGLRVSLNVWFTRNPEASEDLRLLQHPPRLGPAALSLRLFGQGPQQQWPSGVDAMARRTLKTLKLPWRGGTLRRRSGGWFQSLGSKRSLDSEESNSFSTAQRARLMQAAFQQFFGRQKQRCSGSCVAAAIRRRERQVRINLPKWHDYGHLSMPRLGTLRCRCPAKRATLLRPLPGLVVLKNHGCLRGERGRKVLERAARLLQHQNQAMRFGDLPMWALCLAKRCAPPGFRKVKYDQLIVNAYNVGEGILPHIDLLKFDERVLGISLAAEATMIFRRVQPEALPVKPGDECRLPTESADAVRITLQPGDVYGLQGPARYQWTHEIVPVKARRISLTFRRLLNSSWIGVSPSDQRQADPAPSESMTAENDGKRGNLDPVGSCGKMHVSMD